MIWSVAFSRALVGAGLADLTITNTPQVNGYWFDEDGIIEPEIEARTSFAAESAHVAGSLATQSVTALGTLGLTIYTQATDDVTLKAQKRALEAVVRQFTYTASLDLGGGPDAYTCLAGRLSWGTADSGMAKARLAKAIVTIPVQPLEG